MVLPGIPRLDKQLRRFFAVDIHIHQYPEVFSPFGIFQFNLAARSELVDSKLFGDTRGLNSLLLAKLCVGFNELLSRAPDHERRECRVSTEFSWLMGPAIQIIERLISDRADVCFDTDVIEILLKIPAMRHWAGDQINEYKDRLNELIPAWHKFNDAYFWQSIEEARTSLAEKDKRLTDAWEVLWRGHYWQFESDSFDRVLGFINTTQYEDDQLVALSLAFRGYTQFEQPPEWQSQLEEVVAGKEALATNLQELLNPPVSETWFYPDFTNSQLRVS